MKYRMLALLLCLALVLTGCSFPGLGLKRFSRMEYEHVEESELAEVSERCQNIAKSSYDLDKVEDAIWELYDLYDWIYTMYHLTDIHYCADLTDVYWRDEHDYCLDMTNLADEALDDLYRALALSPIRPQLEGDDYFGTGFFDDYEGESTWDETYLDYLTRENRMVSRYYELMNELPEEYDGDTPAVQEAQELFVEMVQLRQELAAYVGCDSYAQYAYDTFYRDYTPEQAEQLMEDIRQELVPLYRQIGDFWGEDRPWYSEREMMRYVRKTAKAMGGDVQDAFRLMERNGLYDVLYAENKYDSSFEVYLTSFREPFLFVNPIGHPYDAMSMTHEFGHFCNDYVSDGSTAPTDVAEIFSQGMEYLSLVYGPATEEMVQMKLKDGLICYVEQANYAAFEHQVYELSPQELTVEHVSELYEQLCRDYGDEESEGWEYVTVSHYFTDPMYIISYVVSNDTAFELYRMELEAPGEGLQCFLDNLDTEAQTVSEFAEQTGLESPFAPGRMERIAAVFSEMLG